MFPEEVESNFNYLFKNKVISKKRCPVKVNIYFSD